MNKPWSSSNFSLVKWYGLASLVVFIASIISLWVHPEKLGFVVSSIIGFICVLLFTSVIVSTYAAENMAINLLLLSKFTDEVTAKSYQVKDGILVSVEVDNGVIGGLHNIGENSGIHVYEIPGKYYILLEISCLPFGQTKVRVYKHS